MDRRWIDKVDIRMDRQKIDGQKKEDRWIEDRWIEDRWIEDKVDRSMDRYHKQIFFLG